MASIGFPAVILPKRGTFITFSSEFKYSFSPSISMVLNLLDEFYVIVNILKHAFIYIIICKF